MVTIPLLGIVAVIVFFAIRSGYTTVTVGVLLALFGFLLHDSSAGPSITHLIDTIRR